MKNMYFLVAGVILIVVIVVATFLQGPGTDQDTTPPDTVGTPTDSGDQLNPDEQPMANIRVTAPTLHAVLTSPFVLTGEARVFENTVNYRLTDEDGTVLAEGFTTALSPDVGQFGSFTEEIAFTPPKGDVGTLEVFTHSAMDGGEIEKVRIPVRFTAEATTMVKVYFSNANLDPNADVCDQTYAVDREVFVTPAIGKAALDELLQGPTAEERRNGYTTNINTDAKVVSLVIQDGVATVHFDRAFQRNMGGSCKVTAVRSQIESTLKQFPSVEQVIITVEGVPDAEVLQP